MKIPLLLLLAINVWVAGFYLGCSGQLAHEVQDAQLTQAGSTDANLLNIFAKKHLDGLAWQATSLAMNSKGIYVGTIIGNIYFLPWAKKLSDMKAQPLLLGRFETVRGLAVNEQFLYASTKPGHTGDREKWVNRASELARISLANPQEIKIFPQPFFCCDGTNQHALNGLLLEGTSLYASIGVLGDGDRQGLNGAEGAKGGYPGHLIRIDLQACGSFQGDVSQCVTSLAKGMRNPYRFTKVNAAPHQGFWISDNNNNGNAEFRAFEKIYKVRNTSPEPDFGHPYCVPVARQNEIVNFFDQPLKVTLEYRGTIGAQSCTAFPYAIATTKDGTNGPGLTGIAYLPQQQKIVYASHMLATLYVLDPGKDEGKLQTTASQYRARILAEKSYADAHFVDLQVYNGVLYGLSIEGDLFQFGKGGSGVVDVVPGGEVARPEAYSSRACLGCHGGDLKGGVGPSLTNLYLSWQPWANSNAPIINEDYIYHSLMKPNETIVPGYQANVMPNFSADPSFAVQARELASYLWAQQPAPIRSDAVKQCQTKNFINTCIDAKQNVSYLLLCNQASGNHDFAGKDADSSLRLSPAAMRVIPCSPKGCKENQLWHNDECQ
jgi:hypothetical protein